MQLPDPLAPGEPAWEAGERAIADGCNGRDPQPAIDEMVRHLIDNNVSATEIREWEQYVRTRIASPEPDDIEA